MRASMRASTLMPVRMHEVPRRPNYDRGVLSASKHFLLCFVKFILDGRSES